MDYSKDEMRVHNLFPTAVGESIRDVTTQEKNFFDKLKDEPRNQNIGNTFTKNIHILNEPELSDLKTDLTDIVNSYFRTIMKPENNVEVYITVSWINYTEAGQWHHSHSHSNSIISGVYYIDTDESDKIKFENPLKMPLGLNVKSNEFNHWNSQEWWLSTPKNNVLLFPSSMMHRVDGTTKKDARVSLAFNTFLKGDINAGLVELAL